MQISETLSQDLHKQFTVTVLASELEGRVNARLEEMKPRVNLKGFRPGKAPVSFLKKQFGKSIMGEVVEAAVNEGSQKAISDNQLKPALQPRIEPVGDVSDVVNGKADLQFTVTVDLMPEFQTTDVAKLKVEKITAEVTDADLDEALQTLAKQSRGYAARPEGEAAQKDDIATIDFVGSVEDVVDGKADLTFKVIVDLMPDFTTTDVSKLTVERLTADITDAESLGKVRAHKQAMKAKAKAKSSATK